uniref:uncharacterized protein LOC105351932 n=1 Tax=Fragaria vesca subsp. vesca TaxID=101020 RepID=UPI0005CA4C45|nr:PREDICTED: uncharacterized protein LOC105351932 [Fragaria vesca subsp. vesca]
MDDTSNFVEMTFASNSSLNGDVNLPSNNVEGAGSDGFRSAVAELIKFHVVDIVAICELRIQFDRVKSDFSHMGFPTSRIIEARGFSGGIWLLRDSNKIKVDFVDESSQFIVVKVSIPGKPPWLFTVIYGSPDHSIRASLWEQLDRLMLSTNLPCSFIGDFNELVYAADKNFGSLSGRFAGLREWINRNGLIDMGFQGSCYTWSNHRIKERLDRGFCCTDWRSIFDEAFIRHLPKIRSDHCPILLQLHSNNAVNRSASPFRFQAMWANQNEYSEFVSSSWNSFDGNFQHTISLLSSALSIWNREVFSNLFHKKKHILARIGGIEKARDRFENLYLINLESTLIQEYNNICEQENLFWRQKSREKWLQDGDKNTRFFHLTTLVRRRRNKIEGIFDAQDVWHTDLNDMKNIAIEFFTNLFSMQSFDDSRFFIECLFPDIDK